MNARPTNPFLQQAPIPGVRHIVVVGSGKGGVGKSTVAANLALALKHRGKSVGLLDADIYGPSLPRMLGSMHQKPELLESKIVPLTRFGIKLMSMGFLVDEATAIVWRGPMLFKAIEQFFRDVEWGELDYLVIDLPPGTGDVLLTIAQKVPVSAGVTVCTPQNIALVDAKKAINMFEQVNIPLAGVVENMAYFVAPGSGEHMTLFPRGDLDVYLETHGINKLAQIPFHPSVALASEAGIPVVEGAPDSEEASAFLALAEKVVAKCER